MPMNVTAKPKSIFSLLDDGASWHIMFITTQKRRQKEKQNQKQ
jgi:hypothetical protein